jgi:hypothetical protein
MFLSEGKEQLDKASAVGRRSTMVKNLEMKIMTLF